MNDKGLFRWESFLVVLFVLVVFGFGFTTPYFFYYRNLFDMTLIFGEKALIALTMAFVIVTANIDISVASIMGLSSSVLAVLYRAGVPIGFAIVAALVTGALCGFINGWVTTRFNLPSMIVTLANFSFFRGIAYVLLGDEAVTGYPREFGFIGRGYIPGTPIPFVLVVFAVLAVVASLILHRTTIGRKIFAIGSNPEASRAAGIPVQRITRVLFIVSGLMASIAGVFLTARIGTTRPNLATGFELEIITIVILGGVVITGGRGKIWGVVLASVFVGTLRYGLGLNNIPGQYMLVMTGGLLLLSIIVNNVLRRVKERQLLSQTGIENTIQGS